MDATIFILSDGIVRNGNISQGWQAYIDYFKSIFDDLTTLKNNPNRFFLMLIQFYKNHRNINLHVITPSDSRYVVFGTNDVHDGNGMRDAFLFCDINNDCYQPWFYQHSPDNITTVFNRNDPVIWCSILAKVHQMNQQSEFYLRISNQGLQNHVFFVPLLIT